ncbi:hypothetical protein [Pseudomonas sp.]|uniref:hypothetical protein n=1 Tax=Pseudomonas sp. TaxID=306 RepID=UPI001B25D2D4|nr:hypothetical protein [Pseudomonas sp.]MBO9549233.1 hypothetical protein [Pseudomonas sp.]
MANEKWRPFSLKQFKVSPNDLKLKPDATSLDTEPGVALSVARYKPSPSTLNQIYTICSRFFEYIIEDGTAAANPFRMIKKRTLNRGAPQEEGSNRALTPLQWDYVLVTAERMAQDEPERHERTLFIVATLLDYMRRC